MCRSNPNPNAATCGPNIPTLQKLGLTAVPAKRGNVNHRETLKAPAELLADIETCLAEVERVVDDTTDIRTVA